MARRTGRMEDIDEIVDREMTKIRVDVMTDKGWMPEESQDQEDNNVS